MSKSSSTQHAASSPEDTPHISLDDVLNTPAYLTDMQEFFDEQDFQRCVLFWLTHFCDCKQPLTPESIKYLLANTIAELDHSINKQLNAIIHHERYQTLEAGWRGLWYLAQTMGDTKNIKLKVLDISWAEVSRDINKALEFDQSQLFQKIYSEEFGTPGGEPYGAIIGNYEVQHHVSRKHPQDDITTLDGLAEIAAASFAPFICGASPELFGLDAFGDLRYPINLQAVFAQTEYIRWRALRNKPDTRFLGLTLPRTLMRRPYRTKPGSYKGLFFYEDARHQLWGNASFAFGGILLREFANVGWFGHIRGVPRDHAGGGLVTTLPTDVFDLEPEGLNWKPSTEVVITDTIERDLSHLGFIPLCQCFATPLAAFYSNPSMQIIKKLNNKEAELNAKLASMLQHVLCGSRVAHYIKVMIRDKIGSFLTPLDCQNFVQKWLFEYTTGRDDLDWESQARYPLRESSVSVSEHPDRPGNYVCEIHLVPHYQTDQMVSELELVTELVQAGGH